MKLLLAGNKTIWRATVAAVSVSGFMLAAGPGAAEQSDIDAMRRQTEQLRSDAREIRRDVQLAQIQPGAAAVIENRLNQIEKQIQDLTSRVEDLSFQQRKLNDQNERFRADVEQRLDGLERGRNTTGQVAPQRQTPPPQQQQPQRQVQQQNQTQNQPKAPLDWEGRRPTNPNAPTRLTPDQDPDEPDNPALVNPPTANQRTSNPTVADNTTGAVLPDGSQDQQFQYALDLLRASEYDAAIDAFRAFMRKYPTSARNGDVYYWLGEAYFVRNRYQEAAVQFAEGYQKFKAHPKAPDTLLKLAMSMSRMNKKAEACAAFAELKGKFPKSAANTQPTSTTERRKAGCA